MTPKKENISALRQPEYKKVKKIMPHCPVCKMELMGNNSPANPYSCNCGTWESNQTNPAYFKIKGNKL